MGAEMFKVLRQVGQRAFGADDEVGHFSRAEVSQFWRALKSTARMPRFQTAADKERWRELRNQSVIGPTQLALDLG